ncbi:hypothetical protein GCM10007415_17190 [Parapedobacter pyrenivorans]|uniref:Cytochrome C and Quinol oxidase polypeptide I n=1 Tax=Parapedobacter pyrenivorans TaxID=1305674 RepID=A0A917M8J4_9SPHI|nr:hypothetical protein [Parapedobacter pyrenivorans]GGG84570.1 hypothetical protein GCM10007415_17190 [Parapedobacter pyrenivorans]
MVALNIGRAPHRVAVLPFYGTGALFFALLTVLLFVAAGELTGHHFSPHLLAIVHAAALGWGTMIIFGAAYQLLPVICERDLYSVPFAVASYVMLTVGALLLVWSFWVFEVGVLMITGGALVVVAAVLYAINTCATAARQQRVNVQQVFLVSSALWLFITVIIGLLLTINLSHTFIPRNHLDMLKLHAHAGLAGWFLQLITGVSTKLVPMFLLGKSKREWLLYTALVLQNIGLILFLADGYFNPITAKMLIYAGIVALGTLAWLIYLADVYRNRLRRKIEPLMKHTAISFLNLAVGFVLLPVAFYFSDSRWVSLYGTFLFLGWITAIILGTTFKTLPFIVWTSHYRHLTGKVIVPLPKQLYNERLIGYQFYLYLSAFVSLIIGLIADCAPVVRVALILWMILAAVYVANVAKTIFHKPMITDGNKTQ